MAMCKLNRKSAIIVRDQRAPNDETLASSERKSAVKQVIVRKATTKVAGRDDLGETCVDEVATKPFLRSVCISSLFIVANFSWQAIPRLASSLISVHTSDSLNS
jgi:hypothetical protein